MSTWLITGCSTGLGRALAGIVIGAGHNVAFTTLRGSHYRPSSRSHHWNRVRCSAGLGHVDLYTATRHYFGWYAWNVLELDARDVALHFGHQDGGELVRKLYGHPDATLARERVREAFRQAPSVPIPLVAVAG